tara:strand:+ start:2136 stop:2414 length:279 start_codon:yes stop_codon:yes gene_type:complete
MTENQSIKDTLNIIRKALEDDNSNTSSTKEDILILNKLVKEDGTIDILDENILNKDEVKDIINKKVTEIFENHFNNWLDKNIPEYLDKHIKK